MTFKDLEKTITKAELFKKYKPNEICFAVCFVVADDGELMADMPVLFFASADKAIEEAKRTGESVFAYTRKYVKNCFNPHLLYEELADNITKKGFKYNFPYCIEAKEEFEKITKRWFNKHFGKAWFADEFIGKLVE